MTAQITDRPFKDARNVIFASADIPLGREVKLYAGQRLQLDGETVWFPLSALVRIEVGSSGIIAGWANDGHTVGLVECLHSVEESDPWIVAITGSAIAVPGILIKSMIERSPTFSRAAMLGLHNMVCDARQIAEFHANDKAGAKIAKLLLCLDKATGPNELVAVNQAEIGRWLGLQRTTVCGAMKEMKRRKLITYARTHVSILDREGLRLPSV